MDDSRVSSQQDPPDGAPFKYVVGTNDMKTMPCEVCHQPTSPWKLAYVDGHRRCPACQESAAQERQHKRKTIMLVAGAIAAFLLIAAVAVGLSYSQYRASPAYSLDQLQDALYGGSVIVTGRYLDDVTLVDELAAAHMRQTGEDETRWQMGVAFAVEKIPSAIAANAFVDEWDEDSAIAITLVPGIRPEGVFYVELHMLMEPVDYQGDEVWRITHVANADDFIASLISGVSNSELAESLSD